MKRRDEVAVGVFITIAVIVGIVGTLWLARRGFSKSYDMYARFAWGDNLKQGQPVNLAGIQIGYVDQVELNEAGYLDVTMNIERQYRIPEGTTAIVANAGFFGDKEIELRPCGVGPALPSADTPVSGVSSGSARATVRVPSCPLRSFMPPGDTIPTGKSAPTMDQLLTRVDSVSAALTIVAQTVQKQFVQEGGLQDLRKTIASTNALVLELNKVAAEQSKGLTETLATFRRSLNAIDSARLDSTVRNFQASSDHHASMTENLATTTARLDTVMAKVQTGDGTAAKLLNDPSVYNDLHRLLAQLDSLTADIKKNPKKYINVKVF